MTDSNNASFSVGIRLAEVGAIIASSFGFAALMGWMAGIHYLTTLVRDSIPMAPSTALMFTLLGLAVFTHARSPCRGYARRFGVSVAVTSTGIATLLLFLSLMGIKSKVEHLGLNITGSIAGATIGHMAPLTAALFVMSGSAFLFLSGPSTRSKWRAKLASFLSGVVLVVSVILLLAYLLGTPLMYDSNFIPPALSTALAFLALGAALAGLSVMRAWPDEFPPKAENIRAVRVLALLFALSSGAIVSTAYFHFRYYQNHLHEEVKRNLSTIADMKANELAWWRNERLNDGLDLVENEKLASLLRQLLVISNDDTAKTSLGAWMNTYRTRHEYEQIVFVDVNGITQLASPELPSLGSNIARRAVDAINSVEVKFSDLESDPIDDCTHLAVLAPILDDASSGVCIGAIILRIDPTRFLYPLIRRWPTSETTAETLLVRREGDQVVALNSHGLQKHSTLLAHMASSALLSPSVMDVIGRESTTEPADKRTTVLAAACAVADSPWFIITTMDIAEGQAPLYQRLWLMVTLMAALLFGTGAAMAFVWRHQRARFYRGQMDMLSALNASEERYRLALDRMVEGFQIIDHEFRYVYVNDAAAAQGHRSKEALLGMSMVDVFPEIKSTMFYGALQTCQESQKHVHMENEFVYPDGQTRWFDLFLEPVAEGTLILSLDIEERKKSESRVEHLNRVLRTIRSINQLIVHETTPESIIQIACRRLTAHGTYGAALIILLDETGDPTIHATAHMDDPDGILAAHLEANRLPACSERAVLSDDAVLLLDHSASCQQCPLTSICACKDIMCMRLNYGGIVFGVLTVAFNTGVHPETEERELLVETAGDLAYALNAIRTECAHAQSETSLRNLQEQLQQSQKMEAVGRLAGGVAHDFNNILTVISGHAELALQGLAEDVPVAEDLREIYKASGRAAELTRQLLAFARKQTIVPKVLDLNSAITDILKMLRRMIGEDIDILWRPGENLWPVKLDPVQLDQLLANLFVNARDAISGEGRITIETCTAVFTKEYCRNHVGFVPGSYVQLAVSDDGSGMDNETIASIFEPFFTTKPQGEGTGLGLATVYGIVKQNEGFINVYSELKHGTTFKIYFRPTESPNAESDSAPELTTTQSGTETILLVEDEPSLLALGKRLLEGLGYTVLTAGTPQDAMKIGQTYEEPICLLLTDVIMPEMNGHVLWRQLAALRPDLKCLFMSGYTSHVFAHRGVLEDGVNFLQKPFSVESISAKIREVLDR